MNDEQQVTEKSQENGESKDAEDQNIKINFRIPVKTPSFYSSNIIVQNTPDEVVLSFFEVIHPVVQPEEGEERSRQLETLKGSGVTAECVCRITVAKHRFPGFAQAMAGTAQHILEEFGGVENNANNQQNDRKDQ